MKNQLVKFDNAEFGSVRVMMIDGEPYFVGKDVATALGYNNPRDALKKHVPDKYKKDGVAIRDSIGREQKPVLINEAGMYKLVMRSKLPSAEQFSDWVCEDVLVSVRKTGSYVKDDDRRLETRQNTKKSHKPYTSSIALLIQHLDAFGRKTKPEPWYYGHITNIVQDACEVIKGNRDNAPVANLNKLDQCQQMVANLIVNLIAAGKANSYPEVEVAIIRHLNSLNNLLKGVPLLGGATP